MRILSPPLLLRKSFDRILKASKSGFGFRRSTPHSICAVGLLALPAFGPSAFADKAPAPPQSLLVAENEWADVAAKSGAGIADSMKSRLLEYAEKWSDLGTEPYEFGASYASFEFRSKPRNAAIFKARVFSRHVIDLAFAGRLTGDRRFIEQAVAIMTSAAEQHDAGYYGGTHSGLAVGDVLLGFTLGYAWLHEEMAREERLAVEARIRDLGNWLYRHSFEAFWGRPQPKRYAHNWNMATHARLGLAGLLLGEQAWVDRATKRTREFFRYTVDETGANYEGINYLGYGFSGAVAFAVELKRQGGPDLFAEFPKIREVPRFVQWLLKPWGGGLVPLNQSGERPPNHGWLFYLLSRYRDGEGLWTWLRLMEEASEGDVSYGAFPLPHPSNLAFGILWHDPDLKPRRPEEEAAGNLKLFERGIAVARDGWGDYDTLLTFTSAEVYQAIHNHPDANSFTFYALGECFAADAGPHAMDTDDHNAILVDGIGMGQHDGRPTPAPGEILRARQAGNRVFLRGNAVEAYQERVKADIALRDLGLMLGDARHLVISDRFSAPGGEDEEKSYVWNFVTGEGNRIRIGDDGRSATIIGARRGRVCDLRVLYPQDVDLSILPPEGRSPMRLQVRHRGEDGHFVVVLYPREPNNPPANMRFNLGGSDKSTENDATNAPSGTLIVRPPEGDAIEWEFVNGAINVSG